AGASSCRSWSPPIRARRASPPRAVPSRTPGTTLVVEQEDIQVALGLGGVIRRVAGDDQTIGADEGGAVGGQALGGALGAAQGQGDGAVAVLLDLGLTGVADQADAEGHLDHLAA